MTRPAIIALISGRCRRASASATVSETADIGCGRAGPRRVAGQALVEFGLVLPVVLALVIGALDLGRYAHAEVARPTYH